MKVVNLYLKKIKNLVVLLLVLTANGLLAQTYSVVTTKGSILYGNDKQELIRGAKVNLNESLTFGDPQSMAVLIGSNGERFILKSKASEERDSELMATIKDVLVPMKRMSALTTRGVDEHKIIDLEAMIGEKNFVIIGDKMALSLDEAYYPMDDQRYFVFSYFLGDEAVNKKVYFENNKLIFVPKTLFSFQGEAIDPSQIKEAKIFYRDEIKKDTKLISSFRPVVLSHDRIKEECDILISFYKDAEMNEASIKEEVNDYLNSFYGKTSKQAVIRWMDNSFQF